jgi:GNAT superfamily N-acetyltransferase
MTDWVIAALGPEDRAAALRLLRETGAEQRRPLFVEPQLPTTGWVARDGDGRLVGLASGVDKPGRTKIRIAVAAAHRRRGCGTALLTAVSQAANPQPTNPQPTNPQPTTPQLATPQPGSEPAGRLGAEPADWPGSEPTDWLGSEPAHQPGCEPAHQPGSEPALQPGPNAAARGPDLKGPIVYGWAVRYSAGEGFLQSRMQRHHDEEIWSVFERSTALPDVKPVPGLTLSPDVELPGLPGVPAPTSGSHRLAAVAPTGQIIGYTEISRAGAQLYTVVDPAWRERGVALWLKTTILATLPADLRYVTTENNAANAPMLAVNRRLGFRPYQHQVAWESDHPR